MSDSLEQGKGAKLVAASLPENKVRRLSVNQGEDNTYSSTVQSYAYDLREKIQRKKIYFFFQVLVRYKKINRVRTSKVVAEKSQMHRELRQLSYRYP